MCMSGVYLGVCKLLDQAAALPADLLPQFQMYRWAFVREGEVGIMGEEAILLYAYVSGEYEQ
jgi:hypothetical protein